MSLFLLAGMVNVLSEICSFFLVGEFHSLIIFNNESFLTDSLAALFVPVCPSPQAAALSAFAEEDQSRAD